LRPFAATCFSAVDLVDLAQIRKKIARGTFLSEFGGQHATIRTKKTGYISLPMAKLYVFCVAYALPITMSKVGDCGLQ